MKSRCVLVGNIAVGVVGGLLIGFLPDLNLTPEQKAGQGTLFGGNSKGEISGVILNPKQNSETSGAVHSITV